jgi:Flp pilus assembly protein TadB
VTAALTLGLLWAGTAGWWVLHRTTARAARWHRDTSDGAAVTGRAPAATSRPGGVPDGGGGTTVVARRGRGATFPARAWNGPAGRAVEAVGRRLRAVVPRPAGTDVAADRRCGLAVLAALPLLLVHPALAVAPSLAALAGPRLAARRRARRHEAAVVDQLPDVVDLLRLTTSAGLPVSAAITAIGARPGGVVGTALVRAATLLDHGGRTAEALSLLQAGCGPAIRPLVDALADHDRYGTPVGPALDRVGVESRLRRRRQAEEAARRLPVTLLFPLVLTTLPAFVALTVLPLLAGSLSSLDSP